jgi:D-Tyr-tRNAtyr deacylase
MPNKLSDQRVIVLEALRHQLRRIEKAKITINNTFVTAVRRGCASVYGVYNEDICNKTNSPCKVENCPLLK